jgi:hypothetical protein
MKLSQEKSFIFRKKIALPRITKTKKPQTPSLALRAYKFTAHIYFLIKTNRYRSLSRQK